MTETIPAIFAILGLSADKTKRNIGTGFFINKTGGFVTAAHTFKKTNQGWVYFAVINKTLIAIENTWSEYRDMDEQVAPLHQDFCVGKLKIDHETGFLTFMPSASLSVNDLLVFKGYASTLYANVEPAEVVTPVKGTVKMDDLWAAEIHSDDEGQEDENIEEFKDLYEFIAEDASPVDEDEPTEFTGHFVAVTPVPSKEIDLNEEINNLIYSEISGIYTQANFEKIFEQLPVEGIFTNGFKFALTNDAISPSGLSGCPVLHSGKAVGMLITKNAAITAEYIMDQLDKQVIPYQTE